MSITPSLFDDDPVAGPGGAALVRRPVAFGQSKNAKTVTRLLAQVESLRAAFEREKRRLDDALIFHAAHVRPREERVAGLRTTVVRALARFLDDRRLTKPDKRVLRDILIEQIDQILAHVATPEPDIAALFEQLHGVGFEEVVQSSIEDARSEMAAFFEAMGVDVEVPDLRVDMTEEDVAAAAAQFGERMRRLHESAVDPAAGRRKKKTKRELREEQRAERFEQVRKISIGAIYKRLVKALHPDLEPDAIVRERKSALMQQVTAAYAANDLHTLLRLEFECLEGDGAGAGSRTDETLSAYAELLRQQAARMKAEIAELPFHPRYQQLMADGGPFGIPRAMDGPLEARRLDGTIEGIEAGLERLSDDRQALLEVRELILMCRQAGRGTSARRRRGN
jgi:hypothetical protein